MRPRYRWQLKTRTLELGVRTSVMGIVNVTPDSFSDGGKFFDRDKAVEHALAMLDEGATILDVGGESTRPGAGVRDSGLPADEELRRVIPVIEGIRRAAPDAIISVDTYKAEVAREAVRAGAEIVNDVSSMRWDSGMAATLEQLHCGVVLMHMRGRPDEWHTLPLMDDVVRVVHSELADAALAATDARIGRNQIVLDPGFGFGKLYEDNYPLLAQLDQLHGLGYPLLVGTSRKSFIGKTLARTGTPVPPSERLYGTVATVTAAILKGAHIVRVHDVKPAVDAAAIADEILRATPEDSSERRSIGDLLA